PQASAAGKVARKTANNALQGLLDRVEQYDSDPVAVFGSFLGQSHKVGDSDVAVKYEDRNLMDSDRAKTAPDYANKSGRKFETFLDQLPWAQKELRQVLKARNEARVRTFGGWFPMFIVSDLRSHEIRLAVFESAIHK